MFQQIIVPLITIDSARFLVFLSAAILLAIANYLIQNDLYNRDFVRRWWNWEEYLSFEFQVSSSESEEAGGTPAVPGKSFEDFERALKELYSSYTFEFAAKESGVDAKALEEIAKTVATAGTQLSTHNWRSASSGNSGGWQVARCLFMLNALMGAIAYESFTSAALKGTTHYSVYLPPAYASSGKRYPVVYFLHGLPGTANDYRSIDQLAAAVEASGHPAIVIGRYLRGETLIEAYWKSVAWPGQGVFIGEPLAAPFRLRR